MAGGAKSGRWDRSREWTLAICVVASLLFHAGIVVLAPHDPPQAPPVVRKVQKPVPVTIRKEQIAKLEKEVKPPEPKKEPEPAPKPPKPADAKKQPPKPPDAPPKPKSADVKPPTPPPPDAGKPKPFVLKNVALKGGVAVQTGEDSNLFGDPSKDATGFKKGLDAPTAADDGAGGSGQAAVREQVVIKQPKALNDVKGEYPPAYRDLRRVVRVELMLTIGVDGNVGTVKIRKGAETEFNDAAMRAVRQLRFEPATRNGTPIAFNLKWTVVFIPEGN